MACAVFAEGLTQDEVLAFIKDKSVNLKSYTADFTMKMVTKDGEVTSIGALAFKKPNKMRMSMDLAGPVKESQIMISDGSIRWQYIPEKSVAFKIDMAKLKAAGKKYADDTAQDISNPLDGLKEEEIVYKGEEDMQGERVFVIEGPLVAIAEGSDAGVSHKADIYIGTDGIVRRYIIRDSSGAVAIEQIFSNIKKDPEIEDTRFIFSPPEGVEIVDSTEDMLKSLEKK